MSNIGRWDQYYIGKTKDDLLMYSNNDDTTYRKGYEWLRYCGTIQDWGCGYGFFKTLCKDNVYIGLDGSCAPNAYMQVDLATYRSCTPGIFMRHVLEHNEEWEQVLRNALSSFYDRMVLVLFTPFSDHTYDMEPIESGTEHRCFSFKKEDITNMFDEYCIRWTLEENLHTETQFHVEHIFYLEK